MHIAEGEYTASGMTRHQHTRVCKCANTKWERERGAYKTPSGEKREERLALLRGRWIAKISCTFWRRVCSVRNDDDERLRYWERLRGPPKHRRGERGPHTATREEADGHGRRKESLGKKRVTVARGPSSTERGARGRSKLHLGRCTFIYIEVGCILRAASLLSAKTVQLQRKSIAPPKTSLAVAKLHPGWCLLAYTAMYTRFWCRKFYLWFSLLFLSVSNFQWFIANSKLLFQKKYIFFTFYVNNPVIAIV